MRETKVTAIFYAILAAVFYAINIPCSKLLLSTVPSSIMAGLLYLGAGMGVGMMFLFRAKHADRQSFLTKKDLPYTVGMVVLDIFAPISLMYGLLYTTSANASLLNNFEIVATTVIAMVVFREVVSKRLWLAISFVTVSSAILSFEDVSSLKFSWGSVFVLLAAVFWGLENNCTRNISDKSTYEIVTIKGVCSGLGSLLIGFAMGERLPPAYYIGLVMLLGFVAYGLSIFFYIKAQKDLGAAKTSAYYAVAPFIGSFLSFVILREELSAQYIIALLFMLVGSAIATVDTLLLRHEHVHTHTITYIQDGAVHTYEITHSHPHSHLMHDNNHHHIHSGSEWEHSHSM